MKDETKNLLRYRANNDEQIEKLKRENKKLTNRMCFIEGRCPHCLNWHYPHCGDD